VTRGSYVYDLGTSVEPIHVLLTVILLFFTLAGIIWKVMKSAGRFRNSVLEELKVTRVSIKELLGDLASRNPEALGRVVAAMNEQSVLDFVKAQETKK
jgi:hypothetical protein